MTQAQKEDPSKAPPFRQVKIIHPSTHIPLAANRHQTMRYLRSTRREGACPSSPSGV